MSHRPALLGGSIGSFPRRGFPATTKDGARAGQQRCAIAVQDAPVPAMAPGAPQTKAPRATQPEAPSGVRSPVRIGAEGGQRAKERPDDGREALGLVIDEPVSGLR